MKTGVVIVLLIAIVMFLSYSSVIFATECPTRTYGTPSSSAIRYFSSPFCLSCWQQKEEIQKLTTEHALYVEEYDADGCSSFAAPNRLSGVPAFFINNTMHYGYRTSEQLMELIA